MKSSQKAGIGVDGGGGTVYKYFRDANETNALKTNDAVRWTGRLQRRFENWREQARDQCKLIATNANDCSNWWDLRQRLRLARTRFLRSETPKMGFVSLLE